MMTRGRGGVWIPPKSDDVIYEQPLMTRMSMTIVMVKRKRTLTMMLMTDHHRLLELCWSWRGGSSDWGNFKVADLNIQVQFVVLEAKENLVSTCCSCWGAGTGRTLL